MVEFKENIVSKIKGILFNMGKKLDNLIVICGIVLFGYLSLISFMFSYYNKTLKDEHVFMHKDSIIINIISIIVILAIYKVIDRCITKYYNKVNITLIALVASFIGLVISAYWVYSSGTSPDWDQLYVCQAAMQINEGDYSSLQPGGYIALCPQNLGLVSVLRIVFKIFGPGHYIAFQCLSGGFVFIIIYELYEISSLLAPNEKNAQCFCLILSLLCIPMYIYTVYVYGEILSIGFCVISIAYFIKSLRSNSVINIIIFSLSIGIAVVIRMNSIILAIAMFIVLCINGLKKNNRVLIVLIALVIGVFGINIAHRGMYKSIYPDNAKAIPNLLYISMGMNDDISWYGAGWYDQSNMNTFQNVNYDVDKANEIAINRIEGFLQKCSTNPQWALDFYNRKIQTQWNTPMYQCLALNANTPRRQTEFTKKIYGSKQIQNILDKYMNVYQLIVYVSCLILLVIKLKEKNKYTENYIGILMIIGGFLFSIIWEAKARYILPYFIVMIPYSALGIGKVLTGLKGDKR